MAGKSVLDGYTPSFRAKHRPNSPNVSGGFIMRLLSLVLSAIGLVAVGAVLWVCIALIFGWPQLVRPVVLLAWGAIWRLGVLAIALFILMTLIESLRS